MLKTIVTSVALFALAGLSPALAQLPLKFEVDFPITVGAKQLPPGDYQVVFPSSTFVVVRNLKTHESAAILTNRAQSAKLTAQAMIRFNRYGSRSFLSQIWYGDGDGRQIQPYKIEVEMARSSPRGVEVATVAMRR